MPNITIYMDNDLYIGFLQLEDSKRFELRKKFAELVKDEMNIKNGE